MLPRGEGVPPLRGTGIPFASLRTGLPVHKESVAEGDATNAIRTTKYGKVIPAKAAIQPGPQRRSPVAARHPPPAATLIVIPAKAGIQNANRKPQAASRSQGLKRPVSSRKRLAASAKKADSPGFPALPMPVFVRKMRKLGESVKIPHLPRVAGPTNGL